MTSEIESRTRAAERIVACPADFKVCESCESIVAARVAACPSCSAYRFDSQPGRVIHQAKWLARRERTTVLDEDFL